MSGSERYSTTSSSRQERERSFGKSNEFFRVIENGTGLGTVLVQIVKKLESRCRKRVSGAHITTLALNDARTN